GETFHVESVLVRLQLAEQYTTLGSALPRNFNRMALFSERIGVTTPRTALQLREMDEALRNSLWNVYYIYALQKIDTDQLFACMSDTYHVTFIKGPAPASDPHPPKAELGSLSDRMEGAVRRNSASHQYLSKLNVGIAVGGTRSSFCANYERGLTL